MIRAAHQKFDFPPLFPSTFFFVLSPYQNGYEHIVPPRYFFLCFRVLGPFSRPPRLCPLSRFRYGPFQPFLRPICPIIPSSVFPRPDMTDPFFYLGSRRIRSPVAFLVLLFPTPSLPMPVVQTNRCVPLFLKPFCSPFPSLSQV